MSRESVACTEGDIQETGILLESTLAKKKKEVSATVDAVLQMSMQRRHHFLKILDPTKYSSTQNILANRGVLIACSEFARLKGKYSNAQLVRAVIMFEGKPSQEKICSQFINSLVINRLSQQLKVLLL